MRVPAQVHVVAWDFKKRLISVYSHEAEELVVALYGCREEGLARVGRTRHLPQIGALSAGSCHNGLDRLDLDAEGVATAARKKGSAGYARDHTSRVWTQSSASPSSMSSAHCRRKAEAPGSRTVPNRSRQKAAYPSGLRRCRCHTHATSTSGTNPFSTRASRTARWQLSKAGLKQRRATVDRIIMNALEKRNVPFHLGH